MLASEDLLLAGLWVHLAKPGITYDTHVNLLHQISILERVERNVQSKPIQVKNVKDIYEVSTNTDHCQISVLYGMIFKSVEH